MKARRARRPRTVGATNATALRTRLRRAKKRLQEVEQHYALAMEAINESIYEWDISRDRFTWSPTTMQRVIGVPPEMLKTIRDWQARVHPDDFAQFRAATIAHLKGETPSLECDYRYRALDGTWRWARTHGAAVRDKRGRALRLIGSTGDITELKTRQRQLAEQKAILETTLGRAEQALGQQTATAEVLRVMAGSPSDIQPVLDSILASASRLCKASFAAVFLYDGESLTNAAQLNASPAFAEFLRNMRARPSRETTTRRCALEHRTIHTQDLVNDPDFSPPAAQRRENVRTALSVPMLREDRLVGVITLWRPEVRPFSEEQIQLVQTFADQAVIAIENVRLFKETREALEQQRALAEVLGRMSGSLADTKPVFDEILESCERLFEGYLVGMTLVHADGQVHLGAYRGENKEALERIYPYPLGRDSGSGQAILDGKVVHFADVGAPGSDAPAHVLRGSRAAGFKSIIFAPLIGEGRAIGALWVARRMPAPFSERQTALLETFADQAVIAIQNTRLFNEIREALEQQKASAEVLGAISSSIADARPVFDKIVDSCQRLFSGRIVGLNLLGEDNLLRIGAYHGPNRAQFERIFPVAPGTSILEQRVVHYSDTEHGADVPPPTREGCRAIGVRSVIFAPVLWKGRGLGAIFIGREHVSSFSDKEIALLKTFADQAAIAIENVRLFKAIEEKSRQLEIASRHKSEFLANMSHELRTPLNAIIGFTRIVMRRSHDKLEPQQYENLDKILASGHHLLALINSILDLSKIEAGRVELHPAEVALPAVLEQCLRTVEPLVKPELVDLVKEFDATLPPMYVDEEKLRQIVINLLSNAVKFTQRGSVRLRAQAANGSVAIAVCDTGVGIPPDKLELIFEEFEQADASSTRLYGGTGLGLAIARRLARLMGGDVTADSVVGSGSTFRLTLPLRERAPA
jgi:PAS domain S-box-containing protein